VEFPTEKNKNGKNKLKIHFEEYKKCRWVLVGIVNGYEQQKTLNKRFFASNWKSNKNVFLYLLHFNLCGFTLNRFIWGCNKYLSLKQFDVDLRWLSVRKVFFILNWNNKFSKLVTECRHTKTQKTEIAKSIFKATFLHQLNCWDLRSRYAKSTC
jgi:hypothetical protein